MKSEYKITLWRRLLSRLRGRLWRLRVAWRAYKRPWMFDDGEDE